MKEQKKKKRGELKEAESTLSEMVKTLDELPTDVLSQLNDNLERIEAFNKKHNLTTGSSHGAYAVAHLEELWEANEEFLSICLLGEHVQTRRVPMKAPLEALLLFKTDEDVREWTEDREWVDYVADVKTFSCAKEQGHSTISLTEAWGVSITLSLMSVDFAEHRMPDELLSKLSQGFRVSAAKDGYGEDFFRKIIEN